MFCPPTTRRRSQGLTSRAESRTEAIGGRRTLPPRSPELDPVENVWQLIRQNWLSNRVFESHDDIVAHCCEAWNKLTDQSRRITSLGLRVWAHGF
jgi:transposase